ncbi:MAG: alpha-hydroxy-acid oxidizing protein [Deltaproteobacteria bacterium]|nr:alpha-hydroxy-acid oxidizing protein [Deltaproteobacteria bacterium]
MALTLKGIRDRARELAKGSCRVCPSCDGRVCSGEVPGMGGTGSGVSFRNNVAALGALRLNVRLVHGVSFPRTGTEILGFGLRAPVMVAPIGGISFNLGGAMDEAGYQEAVALGAIDAGLIAGTPDGAPDGIMRMGLAVAERVGGQAIPFVKPWEKARMLEKLGMAKRAGCRVVACDLDSVGLITLRLMGSPAYPKDRKELAGIIGAAHGLGLSFVVKGIMGPDDALAAVEAGADGLVVSNHGGRVLDSVPGTAEVLPGIAGRLGGRVPILIDGGVRSGVDILKALALGADGVMIGRPFAVAAIGGGREGVALYAETLRAGLEQAMVMTGCADVGSVPASVIHGLGPPVARADSC